MKVKTFIITAGDASDNRQLEEFDRKVNKFCETNKIEGIRDIIIQEGSYHAAIVRTVTYIKPTSE